MILFHLQEQFIGRKRRTTIIRVKWLFYILSEKVCVEIALIKCPPPSEMVTPYLEKQTRTTLPERITSSLSHH